MTLGGKIWQAVFAVAATAVSASAQSIDFNRDVLPVLTTHCLECHGPDAAARQAELRLDESDSALAKRDGSPAIVPGRPDQSTVIARIASSDPEERMPPKETGRALSAEQIRTLRDWIEQGAQYSEHWAFKPPAPSPLPAVHNAAPCDSAVDRFVLNRLAQAGVRPASPASRETLIRRATLDLLGVPPSPEEVDAFVAETSPEAFQRLTDRLLASPQYGERWGRHWLDVARYADSGGFETDIFFGHAWRYRDYVIRALNADKPFDDFIREQIAGDEIMPADGEAAMATGLFTVGPVLQEAGMVTGKLEYDQLTDAVDTVGAAFLGLTLGCARCHDHKYDPVSQREYFALQALFAASDQFDFKADGTRFRGRAALKNTLKEFEEAQARSRREAVCYADEAYPEIPVRLLAHRDEPVVVRLLKRGELEQPAEVVEPGLPLRLGGQRPAIGKADRRRAALASWIASPQNPLTARVLVNRVWHWHFGNGLLRTTSDFGVRGERPTHPELLDWLAMDFLSPEAADSAWSLKRLHRTILHSRTYQMSSAADPKALANDPDNRLLSRFQPRRLEAETIWDSQRSAAGTLVQSMYGLPIAPPLDEQEQIGNFRKWPTSTPAESNRRAVYILVRRSFRFPSFSAFDLPDNIASCGQRYVTTVPSQALTLLNNRSVHEQTAAFAQRLLSETDGSPDAVAALAWRYVYGRPITTEEISCVRSFLSTNPTTAATKPSAVCDLCLALFNSNEFNYLP